MLNAVDSESALALRLLTKTAATGVRPIVFWIGAGASRWLGYASWKDLALQLRKEFYQQFPNFENKRALDQITKGDFPAFFQLCRDLDSAAYHRFIVDAFLPKEQTEVYKTFVRLLGRIRPPFVVTTNVDEALEASVAMCQTVQKTDISRCVELIHRRIPFVAKLHGTVSAVQSTVFAQSDYEALLADASYMNSLKYIFTGCTVVFLGYGVRDSHILRLLKENTQEMDLFGPGPHFVVTNDEVPVSSLKRIKYSTRLRPDHSAALSALEYIRQAVDSAQPQGVAVSANVESEEDRAQVFGIVEAGRTAYYISELLPPGTWRTSEEITAQDKSGGSIQASFGLGFTNDEVPFRVSTALHDLAVALICFDYIYLPLNATPGVIAVLGEATFTDLLRQETIRLIHDTARVGILFHWDEPIGGIANAVPQEMGGTRPQQVSEILSRWFKPVPGKETGAQSFLDLIERQTVIYRRSVEIDLPALVCGPLAMPEVTKLLGIGDAILPTQAPRWLRYPYLRMAHLVQTAALCTEYGIQAAKVPFGGVHLSNAAFGVQATDLRADHLASYVLAGPYNSDLGGFLQQDMSILRNILRFRASAEGASFRQEIGQALCVEGGRAFSASVNAGLTRTIPTEVLRRAKDRLVTLMTESARVTPVPAVWGSALQSDSSTRLWRARSEKILLEMCRTRGVGKNDPCICGSGEVLRRCCLPPLRE
jgi:hypothetical protein